jgi:hypothetical protein
MRGFMSLPDRLLKITFTSKHQSGDELLIRRYGTVRKPLALTIAAGTPPL